MDTCEAITINRSFSPHTKQIGQAVKRKGVIYTINGLQEKEAKKKKKLKIH